MPFQLKSKTICLTYSNVLQQFTNFPGLSDTTLLSVDTARQLLDSFTEFIRNNADRRGVQLEYCILGLEYHESGAPHLHIGCRFDNHYRTRDAREFDWHNIHPCIESAKSFPRWIAYCKKGGNYAESGNVDISEKKSVRVKPEELIQLAKTMNKLDFLAYASVHRFQYAKEIWLHANPSLDNTLLDCDPIKGTYDQCFDRIVPNNLWDRSKTLLLVGKSGIGKTTWSKYIIKKPALMVSHMDDLKSFNPVYHKAILFDDVSIKHLPDTSQIHLLDYDNPRSIHCRYSVARIPAGIEKIFTCNTIPVNYDMDAICRRCNLIKCQSLYYSTTLKGVV